MALHTVYKKKKKNILRVNKIKYKYRFYVD